MTSRTRIKAAEPISGTSVRLLLTTGESRIVDLAPYLQGPMFEEIRASAGVFRQLRVDPELGTVVWPNGADIDPDVLVEGLRPAWQEHGVRLSS
ncbi:MAG: DUF2442 domain-containing protein [Gemmatimonadota bacterium]